MSHRHLMARFRQASAMFDWRPAPQYEAPGITRDHHSAPLENGDRLHAYRINVQATNPWVFEIHPHDMPSRLPLRWNPELELFEEEDPQVRGNMVEFLRRYPRSPVSMAIARDERVDPPGTDRSRRNFSPWGRRTKDGWENGRFFPDAESAMRAAERRYLDEAPKWQRQPHRRQDLSDLVTNTGPDYEGLVNPRTDLDDDFGDIFGGSR